MLDIFFRDKSQYHNQLNPVLGYLEQLSSYIQNTRGVSKEVADEKARIILKTHFKDKNVRYFERQENGDREVKDTTLLNYINSNIKEKNVLVPTFTSYMNANKKKSMLSEFIFVNVRRRSVAKKAGQKAKAEGNMELADAKNNEQNMMKIYNNSLSGAFAQAACILYNPTAHSTLTSITRTITSLSNASNEKLIAGNRFYPRGTDVINNVIYIATYADVKFIKSVIEQFNLHIPTIEETVSVLKYSSDLYFRDEKFYQTRIIPYLQKLSGYHLAAICYIGDLYHIRKFNDSFMRNVIGEMIEPVNVPDTDESVCKDIHSINENILNFVHHIFYTKAKGQGKDYDKMFKTGSGLASSIYTTSRHVEDVLRKYKAFFNCFFMTDILPGNSFRLKHMRRRTVVLSDTDSTCFTLDEWIKWLYNGEFRVDDKSIATTGAVAFMAAQAIINQLAILSKGMNISDDHLNTLAMKNEYLWGIHSPCEISKHYFAYTIIQEGNVFKEADIEIKGVHLKNSAVPKFVIADGKDLMKYILSTVANNGKIKFNYVLERIINLENNIRDSVYKGEPVYLKKSKIKNPEAYALEGIKSPYARHLFWKEVFAPKYGDIPNPPYDVIKIPTIVTSKPALNAWIESIEDKELAGRLINWLEANCKKDLPTIYLNDTYVLGNGIPDEIMRIIDIKRIVLDVTIQHRNILETLGVMLYSDKLVSEQFV